MPHVPVESFIIERVSEGGWRVVHRRADLSDLPIADFVSLRDAEEWVSWKSGRPKINPYATAEEDTQPGLIEIAIEPKSKPRGKSCLLRWQSLRPKTPRSRHRSIMNPGKSS